MMVTHPHSSPAMNTLPLLPFHRAGTNGSERLRNLSKITQQGIGEALTLDLHIQNEPVESRLDIRTWP